MELAVRSFVPLVIGLAAWGSVVAEEVDYLSDIKPLLTQQCGKCHGPAKQENGLRLDTTASAFGGGDSGPAIVAGKSAESPLIKAVAGKSDTISKMPPEGPGLTEAQIALLSKWIDEGAKAPTDEQPLPAPVNKHWAFQPVVRAPLPSVRDAAWPHGNIDTFILARLEKEGIAPAAGAGKATLLRRAYLDLVGLLPTPGEVGEFEQDKAPDAYERIVDRLLASPNYGERWGRHWLDLARYADSNGYTRDFGRSIWKYREWVIGSINADMPFDQFTIEQIAGDMLDKPTLEQLTATGFHRNTLINEEGGTDQEQFRVEAVADRVATTGSVFLGLTLGCARCHSHKYDPISQIEYYEFFALLNNCDEPTIEVPSNLQIARGDLEKRAQMRAKVKELDAEMEKQRPQLEEAQKAWEKTLTPQQRGRLPGPVQVAYDMAFEKRDAANKKLIEDHFREIDQARKAFPILEEIYKLKQEEPKIPTTMIMKERDKERETFVHKRGDFLDHGAKVHGGVPAVLPAMLLSLDSSAASAKVRPRGNRLDFAKWLVSPSHPLTPRVVMNRDWQKFFGRGLVETEDDFGTQGTPPTHPDLLDYLALEFVESGWDVKRMHRRVVTSSTYCQSSNFRADLADRDPQNKLLARQSRLRLDSEIVRDVALSAAGLLTDVLGGPSVFPPQPEGVYDFTQDPKNWKAATGADRYRRGMYTHFWRSAPYPALTVFDAPNGNVTCTRRIRSNTPLQALTLANDEAFVECVQAMGQRVVAEAPADPVARAEYAFRLCLSRSPTVAEREALAQIARQETDAFSNDPTAAKELLPKGLETLTSAQVADLAAAISLCRVILNLDEMITRE
jgi:mono/diheme cytochrome c family protein